MLVARTRATAFTCMLHHLSHTPTHEIIDKRSAITAIAIVAEMIISEMFLTEIYIKRGMAVSREGHTRIRK